MVAVSSGVFSFAVDSELISIRKSSGRYRPQFTTAKGDEKKDSVEYASPALGGNSSRQPVSSGLH